MANRPPPPTCTTKSIDPSVPFRGPPSITNVSPNSPSAVPAASPCGSRGSSWAWTVTNDRMKPSAALAVAVAEMPPWNAEEKAVSVPWSSRTPGQPEQSVRMLVKELKKPPPPPPPPSPAPAGTASGGSASASAGSHFQPGTPRTRPITRLLRRADTTLLARPSIVRSGPSHGTWDSAGIRVGRRRPQAGAIDLRSRRTRSSQGTAPIAT
jgi:hypothetical protein